MYAVAGVGNGSETLSVIGLDLKVGHKPKFLLPAKNLKWRKMPMI